MSRKLPNPMPAGLVKPPPPPPPPERRDPCSSCVAAKAGGRLFLTSEDRVDLTGRKTKPGQKRWLRENGFPYRERGDGWPVVACAAVLGVLAPTTKPAQDAEPDLTVFDHHGQAA